jgi:ABC-type transport system substrate-binding protein
MRRSSLGLLVLAFASGCGSGARPSGDSVLRVAIHTEPQTWNRLLASDRVSHVVADQLHEPLVRLNPETQELEPALAESWEFSEDGTRLTFHLRRGVRFSDGDPFGAEDVDFTFRALYEPSTASPLVETAQIDGKPFGVELVDETTVAFVLPRRTAVVERVFDSIAILPSHLLDASLRRKTMPPTPVSAPRSRASSGSGPSFSGSTSPGSESSSNGIRITGNARTTAAGFLGSIVWFSRSCPTRTPGSSAFARARWTFSSS